jgi:hypothetical protein
MPDPIAFVVMPFDRKPTGIATPGVPVEVDFDALWVKVYKPILEELGYQAVRADRDVGALVINDMIQRLAIADLVVADITLPNANVYYEVGVRHAAKRAGCVLLAADWAVPVFDVVAMRRLRFPLPEGDITDATAATALAALRGALEDLAGGDSRPRQGGGDAGGRGRDRGRREVEAQDDDRRPARERRRTARRAGPGRPAGRPGPARGVAVTAAQATVMRGSR